MKYSLLFLFLFFSAVTGLHGQSRNLRLMDSTRDFIITCSVQDSEGNIIVGGYEEGGFERAVYCKTDSRGNIIWMKRLLHGHPLSIIRSQNGDYLSTGYTETGSGMMAVRFSTDGTFIWKNLSFLSYPHIGNWTLGGMTELSDTTFAICGHFIVDADVDRMSGLIVVFSTATGDMKWRKAYKNNIDFSPYGFAFNAILAVGNRILAAGNFTYDLGNPTRGLLMWMDADGNNPVAHFYTDTLSWLGNTYTYYDFTQLFFREGKVIVGGRGFKDGTGSGPYEFVLAGSLDTASLVLGGNYCASPAHKYIFKSTGSLYAPVVAAGLNDYYLGFSPGDPFSSGNIVHTVVTHIKDDSVYYCVRKNADSAASNVNILPTGDDSIAILENAGLRNYFTWIDFSYKNAPCSVMDTALSFKGFSSGMLTNTFPIVIVTAGYTLSVLDTMNVTPVSTEFCNSLAVAAPIRTIHDPVIYPNPCSRNVYLEPATSYFDGKQMQAHCTLTDILGRRILITEQQEGNRLCLKLPEGFHGIAYCRVEYGNVAVFAKTLIVE